MTLETVDTSEVEDLNYSKWCETVDLDSAEEKMLLTAGDPTTDQKILNELLNSSKQGGDICDFLLFNPGLPLDNAAKFISTKHQQKFERLDKLSIIDLRKKYENLSNNKDLLSRISYLQDSFVEEELSWDPSMDGQAVRFLREFYVIFTSGSNEKKTLMKEFFPETYQFLEKLYLQKIIEPFLFWTLDDDGDNLFDRTKFSYQFDSRILVIKGGWGDPGSVSFLTYPEEFKPLAEVDQDFIYNIESGQFALTNKLIETSDLIKIGFEVGAGMGDGYYPTIPFFDHLGELQMVTTYFTHMVDSEWLDQRIDDSQCNFDLHSHRIPLEMGYLDCDGSFFFGDSTWFHNGPGDDLIIEFSDLPVDKYLVVRFIDVDQENRTWAVSVMRDKAKRNFEVLFKVFPELTNRNDNF